MRLLLLTAIIVCGANVGFAVEPKKAAAPNVDYILQPLDLLRIVIFQEPDLERQVRISQEYTVNLPLIGSVDLSGKSVRQAEEMIRARYDADYLKNPQITITVLEYTQRTVQVLGAVNQPGAIAFTPEKQMDLVEAIARAGGHSRLADLKNVRLTRIDAEGKSQTSTINVDELMKGVSSEKRQLQKGDIIFVPERIF